MLSPPPVNYSLEEQDTGLKWIDGKPIYQKTVDVGAMPNATTKIVAHNISNIDSIVSVFGICDTSEHTYALPLPYVGYADSVTIQVSMDKTTIGIRDNYNWSSHTGYITLQYTKTTDQPQSQS